MKHGGQKERGGEDEEETGEVGRFLISTGLFQMPVLTSFLEVAAAL